MSFWWNGLENDREAFIAKGILLQPENLEEAALWNSHSMESRLIDIWATVDDFMGCYVRQGGVTDEKLDSYAERMESLVSMVCSDTTRGPGFAETVREAQWEVINFAYGDNAFGYEGRACMQWFDQFMYDINFDLV